MSPHLARLLPGLVALALALGTLAPRGDAEVAARERQLLEKIAERHGNLESYWFEGTFEVESSVDGETQTITAPVRVAGRKPDRMLEDLVHPTLGQAMASDGTKTWVYRAALGQYVTRPGAVPPALDSASTASSGNVTRGVFIMLRHPLAGATGSRTLPAESLTLDGKSIRCTVVEVTSAVATRTYWIDPASRKVLRHRITATAVGAKFETRRVETITWSRVVLNQPLPDTLFAFRAPEGAREVAAFEAPGAQTRTDLSGQKAMDFTLKDLAGKTHKLSEQRGKVVMLDFWATWCGPCRVQMPNVEKLYKEYKDKGLVVFAINQRESGETAKRYLSRYAYSTPTLLDADGAVGEQYHVDGIPSLFVIDREGTISAHFVGVRGVEDLRQALTKAGL